jgi:hypothetical protein
MPDEVEDAGFARKRARRPQMLMRQQEAPGLGAAQVQAWGWQFNLGHI